MTPPPPSRQGGRELKQDYPNNEILVETGWLAEHLADPGLCLIDMRPLSRYQKRHIKGAVNLSPSEIIDPLHLREWLIAPPERMEEVLGTVGVSNESRVIIYDDGQNHTSAHLFWALELYGHERAALLNGGYLKWKKEGKEVTTEVPDPHRAKFKATPNPSRLADKEYILSVLGNPGVVILDTRLPQEYSGEFALADRRGHIPGAVNLNWDDVLQKGRVTPFRPAEELEQLFIGLGLSPEKEIVAYCQIGTRSAHSYFTMRLMGYPKVRNYDASWQEWGNDPDLPIEEG